MRKYGEPIRRKKEITQLVHIIREKPWDQRGSMRLSIDSLKVHTCSCDFIGPGLFIPQPIGDHHSEIYFLISLLRTALDEGKVTFSRTEEMRKVVKCSRKLTRLPRTGFLREIGPTNSNSVKKITPYSLECSCDVEHKILFKGSCLEYF